MNPSGNVPLPEWQQYPVFGDLIGNQEKSRALAGDCIESCAAIDRILRTGSPREQEAAQKALNAFGHALALLKEATRFGDCHQDTCATEMR
jgi:hypothetical protein